MRRTVLLVFVGGMTLVTACTPSTIAQQYSQYSGCPEDKVEVDPLLTPSSGWSKYRASGCGSGVVFYCADEYRCQSPKLAVAKRHARQFGCQMHDVRVESLGSGAFLADACGQRITYECFDDKEYIVRCIAETSEYELRRSTTH